MVDSSKCNRVQRLCESVVKLEIRMQKQVAPCVGKLKLQFLLKWPKCQVPSKVVVFLGVMLSVVLPRGG